MLTMWRYVQTAAWPQPEPQSDRSSLYINNGDVTQTAAVRAAAVCLGHEENILEQFCIWRLTPSPNTQEGETRIMQQVNRHWCLLGWSTSIFLAIYTDILSYKEQTDLSVLDWPVSLPRIRRAEQSEAWRVSFQIGYRLAGQAMSV